MAIAQKLSGLFTALIDLIDGASLEAMKADREENTPAVAAAAGRIQRGQKPAILLFLFASDAEETTRDGAGHPTRLHTTIDIVVLRHLGGEDSARQPSTVTRLGGELDDLADAIFDLLQAVDSPREDLSLASGTTMSPEGQQPVGDIGLYDWTGRRVRVRFTRPVQSL
ncbi:MAG: hypothetical protein ACR2RL_05170 [Gammaproteobacteria bacterium]